jgi:uncharacterized MnhB-related membrane protein
MTAGISVIDILQAITLIFIGVAATVVVLTRQPVPQAILISFYGLLLAIVFVLFQAPDVAFSQIVIGAIALPLMILLALAKIKKQEDESEK